MQRIIISRFTSPLSTLSKRSFMSCGSTLNVAAATTRVATVSVLSRIPSRGFAKKIVDAEPVKSDKQKKQQFVELLEEEISVLSATGEDSGEGAGSLKTEVSSRFLKDLNFKLTEDKEKGVVKLTRNVGNKVVTVTFADQPQGDIADAAAEDEAEGDEEAEGKEEEEEAEAAEEEGEGEEKEEEREQPFRVEITSTSKSGTENKIIFSCFANQGGSFTVSELNTGEGKKIPIQIAIWSEEMQNQLIEFLEPFGITERLSYFIHQYLDQATQRDNVEILQEFKKFVQD